MKQLKKRLYMLIALSLSANVFSLAGCGKGDVALQTGVEGQCGSQTVQAEDIPAKIDAVQGERENADRIMRAYSDEEAERMEKLKQSYEDGTVYPEKLISEVDSAEEAIEGELCYIRTAGEYYLPDRELTDEELLQIIDCNFRIALGANRKTKDEYDAEDRAERAMLEEKVQEADGISEEEAIEITKNALEADLGEESEGMMLRIYDESKGWRTELCVADWSEIKEEDRGAIAYSVQFDPGDDADDWMSYHCTINAVDGSILEAYKMEFGLSDGGYCADAVYYEH